MIRPLRPDPTDLTAARRVTALAYAALPGAPVGDDPDWPPERARAFEARLAHVARHDQPGSWVAEHDGELLGVAAAVRREGLWVLSLVAVTPRAQGGGLGRALVGRAAAHGTGALRGMIAGSPDPRAARLYRRAGFRLHPSMRLLGEVRRDALPAASSLLPVREGGPKDVDLADSVDRRLRGAAHGIDHEQLGTDATLLVCDTLTGQGYAYHRGGRPRVLAATTKRVAVSLLWECLARTAPHTTVDVWRVTAEQEWAVDVALDAGLAVHSTGFLCLRGMRPPAPYLPDGFFG